MAWQPRASVLVDAETWAVDYLTTAWQDEDIVPTFVGDGEPVGVPAIPDYLVTIRRDGGPSDGTFDNPRLRITASAPTRAEAGSLASRVTALLFNAPGDGTCVQVTHLSGPMDAPPSDTGYPRFFSILQPRLRCS